MITSVIPQVAPNMAPLSAEIFLLIAASAILLIDMFLSEGKRSITYLLSLATLVVCGYFSLADYNAGTTVYTFSNMFISDPMANLLKLFSYVAVGLTLVYSRSYATDRGMLGGNLGGEFYVLALFSLLGQMVMISGNNMLSIYLGVELMSLSLYALIALRRDDGRSTEAAMKYFILGALASGFLLYGISMLYGATGTLDLTADRQGRRQRHHQADHPDLRPGVPGRRPGLQTGRGAVPHVGAGRLRRFADGRHAAAGRRAEDWPPSPSASACWSKACCRWRWTGSRC